MQQIVYMISDKKVMNMSIGERITSLRKQQNLSQGKLASILEVSRQAVSKWENDLAAPDTLKLIQLADVLKTDVEYLATGRVSEPKIQQVVVKVPEIQEKIVEKTVEKPVIQYVEKPVIKTVEKLVEKPVIKRITRVKYLRNPFEFVIFGVLCFLLGLLLGRLL